MPQRILSMDSQVLNSIQLCARRTQLQFSLNLQPLTKASALEEGGLIHMMLEVYYTLKFNLHKSDNKFWTLLTESQVLKEQSIIYSPVQAGVDAGRFYGTKMSLSMGEIEETIYQFVEYCKFYEYDSWEALAVEEVGAKLLYEDEDLKMIYTFKIDLIAQNGTMRAPWDHKHSKRRQEPNSLSNQFIGYAWGMGTNYIIVNKIGFQKTLPPKDRFQRDTLMISDVRIQEWIDNTIWWGKMLDFHLTVGHFPMNLTSCDKYSGCIYRHICQKNPDSRELEMDKNFKVGEQWDVAKILEAEVLEPL